MPQQNSWTEHLYRYVEHYYWEPQHLFKAAIPGKTGQAYLEMARKKMREKEVPLNAIFNIGLRLLPNAIVQRFLHTFSKSADKLADPTLELVEVLSRIEELGNFTQPDLTFESAARRIFVEIKIDSHFNLDQVCKYACLHAVLDERCGQQKLPALYLLSPGALSPQWKSSERKAVFEKGQTASAIKSYLLASPFPEKLGSLRLSGGLREKAALALKNMDMGFAPWSEIGLFLKTELASLTCPPASIGDEVLSKLMGDMLGDLKQRNLLA